VCKAWKAALAITLAESILKHAQNVRGKAALPFAISEVNYFSTESSS
jgi:hypothetical protein